ncbi:MAG: serine/threonine protein kinase, partial [Chloroflexota bacterium]|nr:serine/threonine protein kinase [Chloroflexota bacterium]
MDSFIGKVFGPYQIVSEIGRGGMAVVYKARQQNLDRYVAIKMLPPQFALDTEFVRRFQLEARAAAKLKHANIVTIHDVGESNGMNFIVEEFVDGVTLGDLIQREGRLPLARVANIVSQVASALDYA